MENVNLTRVTRKNLRSVLQLKVLPTEEAFVASNSISLAEAYTEEELEPRAIQAGEKVVGFIMYGKWKGADCHWITRLMIDKDHRGRGYAKSAILQVTGELLERKDCEKVSISFEPENKTARSLYLTLGFEETGEIVDGEVRFDLRREQ